MKKRFVQKGRRTAPGRQGRQRDVILCILLAAFLAGAVLGGVLESKSGAEAYILRFLQENTEKSITPAFWREAWITLRWPVGVLLLTVLPCSILTIPGLFFLRGFLLSYGITAVSLGAGTAGVVCSALVFGPACLLTVPVLFVLGASSLLRKGEHRGLTVEQGGLCLGALALCIVLDQAVVPSALTQFLSLVS